MHLIMFLDYVRSRVYFFFSPLFSVQDDVYACVCVCAQLYRILCLKQRTIKSHSWALFSSKSVGRKKKNPNTSEKRIDKVVFVC